MQTEENQEFIWRLPLQHCRFCLFFTDGFELSYKRKFESFNNDLLFGNQNAVPLIRSALEGSVGEGQRTSPGIRTSA